MATTVRVIGVRQALAQSDVDLSQEISREIREATLAAFGDVVQATPVDTGNARNSWRLNQTLETNASVPYQGYRVENTTAYIQTLNDGSSAQAPPRFIEQSFLRYFDEVAVEVIPGELD